MLVTGASSGIGRATARLASEQGARLALVGRNSEELDATLATLSGEGHVVRAFDLDQHDRIRELVTDVADALGGIDVLVHAAGVHSVIPIKRVRSSDVAASLSTNVTASIMLASAFSSRSIPKERPSLVLMSSVVGVVGQPGLSVYSASKGAIVALTKSLALELARDGIRVNCVCPGIVETELTERLRAQVGDAAVEAIEREHPLGFGTAEDVAGAVLYLVSDEARWVTGTSLVIDGGYTAH